MHCIIVSMTLSLLPKVQSIHSLYTVHLFYLTCPPFFSLCFYSFFIFYFGGELGMVGNARKTLSVISKRDSQALNNYGSLTEVDAAGDLSGYQHSSSSMFCYNLYQLLSDPCHTLCWSDLFLMGWAGLPKVWDSLCRFLNSFFSCSWHRT